MERNIAHFAYSARRIAASQWALTTTVSDGDRRLWAPCFRGLKSLSAVPQFPAMPWVASLNGAQCPFFDSCTAATPSVPAPACGHLLDDLVGAREQRWGNGEAQYRCRLVIYNKIEPRGSLNWHLSDRGPLEKPINKNPH